MIGWFKRFLRLEDKDKENASEEASQYVHKKKNDFTKKMVRLKTQSKILHKDAKETQEAVVKMVKDITSNIVAVTPGGKDYDKRK